MHGGKLVLESALGEAVTLSRLHSGKEKIRVSTAAGEKTGAGEFEKVLGHASKELFNCIHAITLDA